MRAIPVLFSLLVLLGAPPALQAQDTTAANPSGESSDAANGLQVKVYTRPEKQVFTGQQLELFIELLTNTWFNRAPRYPDLDLDGVIVVQPEQAGGNISQRKGSKTLSGTRRRYLLYPQQAGTIVIPPISLTPTVAVDGKPVEITVTTDELRLEVMMPEATAGLAQFVTTLKFSVKETYTPGLEQLKVGDALTRTITTHAENALALLLPAIQFTSVEGLQVYPAQPQLDDKASRGHYSGSRTDAATYILQTEGEIELPAIELHWWHPEEQKLHTETLPAVKISVAAAAATNTGQGETLQETGEPLSSLLSRWLRLALDWFNSHLIVITLLAAALYLIWLGWRRYREIIIATLVDYQQRWRASETFYFHRFCLLCKSGDEKKIYAAFWRWLDQLHLPVSTVRTLMKRSHDTEFSGFWNSLERDRYGAAGTPDEIGGDDFMRQTVRLRRGLRAAQEHGGAGKNHSALNPSR